MKRLKWFYPGMKVKRWLLLIFFGIVLIFLSICDKMAVDKKLFLTKYSFFNFDHLDFLLIFSGMILIMIGIQKAFRSILNVLIPEREDEIVDMVFKKRQLEKGPKIVAIGGGTGLPVLLHGLKEVTSNITAIVTVADDGGSSGRLRKDFQVLPPGDIRNCLVSLADEEFLVGNIFQHRFSDQSESLGGHNFGNLFITAMTQVTGDFAEAIRQSSKVLAIRGQVIPSTLENVVLKAKMQSGAILEGESNISKTKEKIEKVFIDPEDCKSIPECIDAINEAEIIIFAPGSLYTSLIPNLLIDEIKQSVLNSKAMKIYVCNIMTQPGETQGYTAYDHVKAIFDHTEKGLLKYIIVNNAPINEDILERYKREKSEPVIINNEELRSLGIKVIQEDLLLSGELVRHDSDKIAKTIISLLIENNIRQRDVYMKRRLGVDIVNGNKLNKKKKKSNGKLD